MLCALQINPGGSGWVNITIFDAERRYEVEDAAASLARALGVFVEVRIIDEESTRVLNHNGAFREVSPTPPQASPTPEQS